VYIPVVLPAERHSELIADLAAKGTRLSKTNMVGFGWSRAENARLRCDMPQVRLIADAFRLIEGQGALVDWCARHITFN
jgi:hypothetical protein